MLGALRPRILPAAMWAAAAGTTYAAYNTWQLPSFRVQADAVEPQAAPQLQESPQLAPPQTEPKTLSQVEPQAAPQLESQSAPQVVDAPPAIQTVPEPVVHNDSESAPKPESVPEPAPVAAPDPEPQPVRLNPKEWTPLTLLEKSQLNHNTWFFRFEGTPNDDGSPLFPVASCLMTRAFVQEGGAAKPVVRPYTPVNKESENDSIDMVVKVYPKGKMGNYMKDLEVGDKLDFKGPLAKYAYKTNSKKAVGMLAAGTGITPMLQVAQKIVDDPSDTTRVSLIFANITEDDILCKTQLDELAARSNGQLQVFYTIEQPRFAGVFWQGGVGRISKHMISKLMPAPGEENVVMVCGPPGFMEAMSGGKSPDRKQGELKGFLKELGYSPEQVFKF